MTLTMALSACGGGGGSGSASNTSNGPTVVSPVADGQMHAACTNCGAADDQTYAGSGVGLWQAIDASAQSDAVNVTLKNVAGRNVSLVFTNEGTTSQTLQPITVSASMISAADMSVSGSNLTSAGSTEPARLKAIHEFNQHGWTSLTTRQATSSAEMVAQTSLVGVASSNVVGTTPRNFWLDDGTSRSTTLEASSHTTDGTTVNIWVENTEYGAGMITPAIVQQLMQTYAGAGGVYDIDTGIGGPLWGQTLYTNMIAPTGQPIDLVVVNIKKDSTPFGIVGYFYGLNNFVNQGSGTSTANSNQDLSLYLDSETLYLGGSAGMQSMRTVMAHETTHMQNFYRRDMVMGQQYAYDTWLEEMTAMMMEDWASFNLDPTYNSVRDNRFLDFMNYNGHGSYGCGLTTWDPMGTTCDSYATNGSFGGFLNRQLGLGFYKALLNDKSSTDSLAVLTDAIHKYRSTSSVAQELLHFTAAADGQIPLSANMAQYSFPAHSEGGFTLPAIDPSTVTRLLPANSPTALLGYSSSVVVRTNVPSTYQETVNVPPGTTLTVVVQ
ncbi:M30 family zinc metallopeptidase [Paraburkholderia adhaesiva]|uniref:M30 family zinc metallopeptidase n=1 Tax=Paraburkholderia adhaesiva TaxID=2883244 RepID=UPI001F3A75DE|nr:hemagglutinin [Paraburkholderia adhaesiva]